MAKPRNETFAIPKPYINTEGIEKEVFIAGIEALFQVTNATEAQK